MTAILDAYVLVALVLEEPAADEAERVLRREIAAVTTLNWAEALDRLVRGRRIPAERVRAVLEPVLAARLSVIGVDLRLATRAATLRQRHYHRRRSPLSLADCVCLAAGGEADTIVSGDRALLAAAEAEGLSTIPLPARS